MSRRTWLVSVSIVGHLAIGIGLFASGVWKLERLESDHRIAAIGVMTQTQAGGGSPDLPEPKFEKKKREEEKKVVKDVQWDKRVEKSEEKKSVEKSGEGEGEGPGEGNDKGPGTDGETTIGPPCLAPPCGGELPKLPDPPKPPVVKVHVLPPNVMGPLRLAGETQIQPPPHVRDLIRDSRKGQVVGTVKVCIGTNGSITSVSMLSSTKYTEYDDKLLSTVRTWRYRPYMVDGVPQPACSPVSFVYTIK